MKLKGRTALVTGGSRGIGRAIAMALAEEGADVAINYVSSETAAKEVAEHIRKLGRRSMLAQADVGDYPDTFRMAQDLLKEFGHLDILVNNAGINSDKTFIETDMVQGIPEKVREKLLSQIPLKRFGTVEEVGRAVVYIVSSDGDYITGAELSINGGLLM